MANDRYRKKDSEGEKESDPFSLHMKASTRKTLKKLFLQCWKSG